MFHLIKLNYDGIKNNNKKKFSIKKYRHCHGVISTLFYVYWYSVNCVVLIESIK